MKSRITINNLTINGPTKINPNKILFEIEEYDYESAIISIDDLRQIKDFIDGVIKEYDK